MASKSYPCFTLFLLQFCVVFGLPSSMEKFWIRTDNEVNTCYHVSSFQYNFFTAQIYCQSVGGSLAILDTYDKQTSFAKMYYNHLGLDADIWIGLHNLYSSELNYYELRWMNGQLIDFTNIIPHESNNTAELCCTMRYQFNHTWYYDNCMNSRNFACQKGTLLLQCIATDCTVDFQYENRAFTLYGTNLGYDDSRSDCQGKGGDLAIVNEEAISKVLNATLPLNLHLWIGLRDIHNVNSPFQFIWVNDTVAISYVNWGLIGPNTDDCVVVTPFSGTYKWVNYPCTSSVYRLCEKEASPISPITSQPTAVATIPSTTDGVTTFESTTSESTTEGSTILESTTSESTTGGSTTLESTTSELGTVQSTTSEFGTEQSTTSLSGTSESITTESATSESTTSASTSELGTTESTTTGSETSGSTAVELSTSESTSSGSESTTVTTEELELGSNSSDLVTLVPTTSDYGQVLIRYYSYVKEVIQVGALTVQSSYRMVGIPTTKILQPIMSWSGISRHQCAFYCTRNLICSHFDYNSSIIFTTDISLCTLYSVKA
ncbi:uncharacterized protein TRIADDRAFT_56679 [Trichoplax adhaerens]|uniref:C-type lectin domain-containing protein n=1 Tax=Trichoplax adhaerens TaxID=10228 RepID=B3RWA5_TRIAD|nr:hypothetical protein TRIADDRAFT_56679 [Trichoplax adhaerens]EDV24658.1 hypothetical protein TRIADDRAFT_56679 [Trichoplax adhaerens]|eukprot:XP_002112548.1 hypothetical protein TRIADDRAFT_56679 [Trichoplax adhaerens]